jgi:hypothetical protein
MLLVQAGDQLHKKVTCTKGMLLTTQAWVVISRPRKQKTIYERNAVDSSRRPITQSGVMCKGNAADSVFGSNFKSTQPKSLKNKSLQAV